MHSIIYFPRAHNIACSDSCSLSYWRSIHRSKEGVDRSSGWAGKRAWRAWVQQACWHPSRSVAPPSLSQIRKTRHMLVELRWGRMQFPHPCWAISYEAAWFKHDLIWPRFDINGVLSPHHNCHPTYNHPKVYVSVPSSIAFLPSPIEASIDSTLLLPFAVYDAVSMVWFGMNAYSRSLCQDSLWYSD